MKRDRFIVLLSAGLDSTVNLKAATLQGDVLLALTFDYGQVAREQEVKRSALICERLFVPHKVIELPWLREIASSGLLSGEIPLVSDEKELSKETMEKVWVPARNLVFIAIGSAFAEAMGADSVVCGFNKEEGEVFPDNSPSFIISANSLLKHATLRKIQLISFTEDMNKEEIARWGWAIGAPLELCWPCYRGGDEICGKCESCFRFINALKRAGIYDEWRRKRGC